MKKRRSGSQSTGARKAACTVSAAALMLGVSNAATIGLKFTVDYCGYPNYVNYVNAPAFGIPMDGWENLTAMGTGYHSCSGTNVFFLSEVISTSTSTDGLHPLPNGSLSLNWSGATENWSGFRGYDPALPPQPITNGPPVPEAQVYAGFIRDGVNFGPGSSGGDNNQPGYSIDITGLKSLFTNTPFAVELIASSDSMQYLTNAFVIDGTANSTQSVIYPNPQVYGNVGDTTWFRATGGGLSTGSGVFNTDHLKIIGNRAAHDTVSGTYNFASTISGAIITDKPVVTMSPQPVVVGPGDTINWSAYAIGVPPLSYQWRKNGTPIPGATSLAYSITNVSFANLANYDLLVTNLYGAATSSVVTMDHIVTAKGSNLVIDSNPKGPEHDGQDFGATWLASSTDSLGTNRTGVMSFNSADPDQITVPGSTNFNSTTGTIMFWMRSPGNTNANDAAIFDRCGTNGMVVRLEIDGNLFVQVSNAVAFTSSTPLSDTNWHHIALVYDQSSTGQLTCYIDGVADIPYSNLGAWSWQPGQEIELGLSHNSSYTPYNGLLDDFRLYSRELTGAEVASVYNSNALVDTNTLALQFNFTTAPSAKGVILTWQCTDVILQTASSVLGPWTDIGAPGTTSFPVVTGKSAQFFRYRGHTPVSLVSNPYLM